jgi:hypothetical protein
MLSPLRLVSIVRILFFVALAYCSPRERGWLMLPPALGPDDAPPRVGSLSSLGKKWRTKRRMEGIQETTMAKHISIVLHQPRGMSSSVRVQSSLSVSFFWVGGWKLGLTAWIRQERYLRVGLLVFPNLIRLCNRTMETIVTLGRRLLEPWNDPPNSKQRRDSLTKTPHQTSSRPGASSSNSSAMT